MHQFFTVIKIILLIVVSSEDWGLFNFTAPSSTVCHFCPANCSGVCSWESSLLPGNVWMVVFGCVSAYFAQKLRIWRM